MRSALVFGGLLLALIVPNVGIFRKERLLAEGTTMLLELAPVDPRSLIQGDYMQLDYALAREMLDSIVSEDRDGRIVVSLDENGVARYVRRHEGGTTPGPDEHLLFYRKRGDRFRVATDAFHFQEGHANRYENARYGELRVDDSGASVLVGLRDEQRRQLR